MIVSEGVGAIPTVGQLSHALRDNYRITLVGPDGKSGAIRLGADRGVNLFSSSGITRRLRNLRRTSPSAVAFVGRSRPSKPTGDWFWYLIKIITSTIPAFVKILFERPPALIVCVDAWYLPITRTAAAIWGRPYAYAMIEIHPEQDNTASALKKKIMKWVESWGVAASAGVIVPDETWARLLRTRYGLPNLRSFLIVTCPGIPHNRCAISSATTSEPLKVYYHGMFSPNRGLECVIIAMKYTQNAILSMRGSGLSENHLKDLIQKEGLKDKVVFLPPVPREELTASAIGQEVGVTAFDGSLANGRFGIGFKTFEYMAAGLALLVPPSRVLRPLIRRTQAGLLYNFGDAQSLAKAINRFASDRQLLVACADSSRRWADSTYNESVQAVIIRVSVKQMIADGCSHSSGKEQF